MIDQEPQIQYPLFLNVGTKVAWTTLNKKANTLLGYPDTDLALTYSNPIIDINSNHWFIVNPEVSELVDLTKCVEYSEIVLPQPKLN
jgi:hypothetical protein